MELQKALQLFVFQVAAHRQDHLDPLRQRRREQVQKIQAAGNLFQAVQHKDARGHFRQIGRQLQPERLQIRGHPKPGFAQDAFPQGKERSGQVRHAQKARHNRFFPVSDELRRKRGFSHAGGGEDQERASAAPITVGVQHLKCLPARHGIPKAGAEENALLLPVPSIAVLSRLFLFNVWQELTHIGGQQIGFQRPGFT